MRTHNDPPDFPTSPPLAAPRQLSGTDDRAARIARLQAARQASSPPSTAPGGARRPAPAASPTRRKHPARGARTVALLSSITATVAVGGGLAFAERPDGGSELAMSVSGTGVQADGAATSAAATATAAKVTSTTAAAATTAAGGTASTATSSTAAAATPSTAAAPATAATPATAAAPTTAAPTTATPTTTAAELQVASASGYADGTYLGTAEYTRWGDVQVEVTISGGAIVDVAVIQVPSDGKSAGINNRATPVLEAQAIAVQGSDLDIVSGATYTSRTYATSLQAALDQAAAAAGAK